MKNNLDWAGDFQTMAQKVANCKSEEMLYLILAKFKDDFNSEYNKLSRAKRLKNGFREQGDPE